MKILYILFIVIVCFVINLVTYYSSESYRNFLKEIKGVEQSKIVLKDEYSIPDNAKKRFLKESNNLNKLDKGMTFISTKTQDEILKDKLEQKVAFIREQERNERKGEEELKKRQNKVNRVIGKIEKKGRVIEKLNRINKKDGLKKVKIPVSDNIKENVMSVYDKKILKSFIEFNLVELKYHGDLLDVTEEYPDKYFEYYSMDLTLLFFPNKGYNELKDIFSVESNGYNFMINEVDNFGDESFYINLGESYEDGFIRVIFKKNNRTFGFKVSKTAYPRVKNILKQL